MAHIKINDLKNFCIQALEKEGMSAKDAAVVAEVLAETDAFGTSSHGTKNLHNYIRKARAGGVDFTAAPAAVAEGPSFALIDAKNAMGMIPSVMAVELACQKASQTGIAICVVKNSCHFGAAGYYANIAAKQGMIGMAMSNVDQNMTIPGARGKVMGNSPFAYAVPSQAVPSVFLDIAMSAVASLRVIQAKKDGLSVPDTWVSDADGLPTTDPSGYPEQGALLPLAAHKGYGLAVMVELLTGVLAGTGTSPCGGIGSWCFDLDQPNNVAHTFLVIDPSLFQPGGIAQPVEEMAQALRSVPKAKNATRIFTPGEIEWGKHAAAEENGINLSPDVEAALVGLAEESGIPLPLF